MPGRQCYHRRFIAMAHQEVCGLPQLLALVLVQIIGWQVLQQLYAEIACNLMRPLRISFLELERLF